MNFVHYGPAAHTRLRRHAPLRIVQICSVVLALLGLGICTATVRAQSNATDAAMSGYISDSAGSALPHAHIVARNLATNVTAETVSDANGYYRFPILKIGTYSVTVKASGFSDLIKSGITLSVGADVRIDEALSVGSAATTIEVVADASVMETSTPITGSTIDSKSLRVLPITSRNIYNYTFFSPGVKGYPTSTFSAPNPAFDGIISSQVQLDGLDNTQRNGSSPIRLVITTPEVVEQNQVIVNGASAEFGHTAGGIINAVTRGGANEYHGQVFAALRPNALRATNALITTGKPSSKWQDYDGNIGGPIRKNRMFFFANFEYNPLANPLAVTITPANAAALGISSSRLGSASASERYPTPSVRVDYKVNDKNNTFFRWSSFSNEEPNDGGGGYIPANTYLFFHDRMQAGEAQLTTTPSATLLNELRFGITQRHDWDTNMQSTTSSDVITLISNVAQIGKNPYAGSSVTEQLAQIVDNVTKTSGRHTAKFGIDWETTDIDLQNSMTRQYTFANLAAYQSTISGATNGYQQATFQFGTPTANNRWHFLNFFAQDEFRVTRNLTLNFGLRYQRIIWPDLDPSAAYIYSRSIHASNLDFMPRFSLEYALSPKTSIRAAAGLYFDNPASLNTFDTISLTNGHKIMSYVFTPSQSYAPVYPNVPTAAQLLNASVPSISTYDPNFRDMYTFQSNLQVEHSLTNDLSLKLQYQFLGMRQGTYGHDTNLGTPLCSLADGRPAFTAKACGTGSSTTPTRPNTSFGQITMVSSGATMDYNGFDLTLKQRLQHGVQFEATYSFSKALGTNEQTSTIEDPTSLKREYGPMSSDIHHNFVLQGYYTPVFKTPGLAWMNNAKLSTMTYMHSGSPLNVYAGSDLNGDQNLNDRPLYYKRNNLRGPNLYEEDLRLGYDIPFAGRYKLNLYAESENLLNHPNRDCKVTTGCTKATNVNITSSLFLSPTSDRNPRGFNFGSKIVF